MAGGYCFEKEWHWEPKRSFRVWLILRLINPAKHLLVWTFRTYYLDFFFCHLCFLWSCFRPMCVPLWPMNKREKSRSVREMLSLRDWISGRGFRIGVASIWNETASTPILCCWVCVHVCACMLLPTCCLCSSKLIYTFWTNSFWFVALISCVSVEVMSSF